VGDAGGFAGGKGEEEEEEEEEEEKKEVKIFASAKNEVKTLLFASWGSAKNCRLIFWIYAIKIPLQGKDFQEEILHPRSC